MSEHANPTPEEWAALTDQHCWICGPDPRWFTVEGVWWPMVWLHDRCKAEHERVQEAKLAETLNASYSIGVPGWTQNWPKYPEARAQLDECIRGPVAERSELQKFRAGEPGVFGELNETLRKLARTEDE